MLRRGWQAYSGALKSHPLRTNLATSGVLTVASDLVAQVLSFENNASQIFKAIRMALFAGFVGAVRWNAHPLHGEANWCRRHHLLDQFFQKNVFMNTF